MLLGGTKDEHYSCFQSSCQLGLRLHNQVIAIIDKVHWKNLLQKVWDYLDNHIGIFVWKYLLMYENELDNH